LIAIWPTKGWWSDHPERRGDAVISYSFVITVDAGNAAIDLHALVQSRLSVRAPIRLSAT
jgi:hypothetical protein